MKHRERIKQLETAAGTLEKPHVVLYHEGRNLPKAEALALHNKRNGTHFREEDVVFVHVKIHSGGKP